MKDQGSNGEAASAKALKEEENRKFIKEFIEKLESDPKSLNAVEKKLGERYLASKARAMKLSERLKELDQALMQAKVELDQEMGKSVGILESVLTIRE